VVVASCYNVKEKSTEITLLDPKSLEKSHSLFKKSVDKPTYYRIAQYLSLVYIVDNRQKQLIVCDLVDNKTRRLPVPGMKDPLIVCILPDSTLFIGDFAEGGEVSRYKLENTTLTPVREFARISFPTGISFDSASQLIHICTAYGPLLIFSLEGEYILRSL